MPLPRVYRPEKTSNGKTDWKSFKEDVVRTLGPAGVAEAYEGFGVVWKNGITKSNGVRECYAVGRGANADDEASAAVNLLNGFYWDSGDAQEKLPFLDFAVRHGKFGSFIEAARFYSEKTGVPMGQVSRNGKGWILEEIYEYRDADGKVRYGSFRYKKPNAKKAFKQYPIRNGTWFKDAESPMDGVEPLPFHLPELLGSADDEPVLIVGGEKDVLRAEKVGLVATTNHGGEGAVRATWERFAGLLPSRDYYLVPDNDEAGRKHVLAVAAVLHPRARSVRIVQLPEVPRGGDLSDWLDMGHDVEELGRLMHQAPLWTPESPDPFAEITTDGDEQDEDATAADLIRINTTIRWAWEGWIPIGVLTAIASEPGVGKTRLCADLLRRVWFGLEFPDGATNPFPAGTRAIWVPADNQHPELGSFPTEFGFPPEALVLNATRRNPFIGTMLDSEEDLADFEARIHRVKPAFVFIDTSLNATDRSSTKPEDAKAFFKPLQEIAGRTQTSIVCVTHTNADGKPLGRRIQGQCRLVISFSKPDPAQEHRRRLWVSKSNALVPAALGVTMKTGENEYDRHPPEKPAEPEAKGRPGRGSKQLDACAAWLEDLICGCPVSVVDIRRALEATEYSAGTLYRAKDLVGAVEYEVQGRKWWKLTDENPFANGDGHDVNLGK